ncbi:MAG: hydroxymethylglutaryl-CoA reductase, degradative [Thermoplasmata archaeon]
MHSSESSGFYKKGIDERIEFVKDFAGLSDDEVRILKMKGPLEIEKADKIIENVISTVEFPMGIAVNFMVNGKDHLIPMAVEEPSIVAAASNAAKVARAKGGFSAYSTDPVMIGEIQIIRTPSLHRAKMAILQNKAKLIEMANTRSHTLASMNAGAKDIQVFVYENPFPMIIVHLLVDVRDAMGANTIDSMCEYIAPEIERITDGKANLRILSNLTTYRVSYASAVFSRDIVGDEVINNIIEADRMARIDIYRAATNNKGIMNGIDAVLVATMNDWRSAEANAHAYAAMSGYGPLARYEKTSEGDLFGYIEIPISVGTVGGTTRSIDKARIAMKILGVKDSSEFSGVLAAVGLAQNFSAVRALASEGIQRGHMELHARNLAISAGASVSDVDGIVDKMIKTGDISLTSAKKLVEDLKRK